MTPPLHLIYGTPPRELVAAPEGAQQCSPLVPGSLALEELEPESATSATLYAPPGTLERRYVLALALRALAPGGSLIALAPKDKGGSRLESELAVFGCEVVGDSRAHHRIARVIRPVALTGLEHAIAEGGLRHYPATQLWTQPGVFSWDRIDEGSALLLTHLPMFAGHGADLGCGMGVLARAVLQSPKVTSLACVELDRRALAAAQKNITDPRAQFTWADVRHATLPASGCDFIVMNPPFHEVGIENQALGLAFIARAAELLKPGGTLWCVANRHLPYERELAMHFTSVSEIAQASGYKVIRAEKSHG